MKRLIHDLKTNRIQAILAPVFKMLEAVFELMIPLLVAAMIDRGITLGDRAALIRNGVLMILLGVVGFLSAVTAQYFAANVSVSCGTRMRRDLFAHISRYSYEQIDAGGTSTLIARMTGDIDQVQTGVNMFLRLFLRSPFIVIGAVIMAFVVDRRAALPFLIAVPALVVVVFLIMFATLPRYQKVRDLLDGVMQRARDNLRGVRVVRAFCREEEESAEFRIGQDHLYDAQIMVGRISALMNPITLVIVNLGIVGLLARGARLVDVDLLSRGAVIALINYMSQILIELIKFANLIITLSRAAAGMRRIDAAFSVRTEKRTGTEIPAFETRGLSVEVRDLSYTYPGAREPALSGIGFSLPTGGTLGIIGGTGSGKTTLVQLIADLCRPQRGTVTLAGVDVASIEEHALRRAVHIVPQRTSLLSGTIRSNLRWGDADASDAALDHALRVAQAYEFVENTEGQLSARVVQGGRNFSGGQRQRLAIARALVGTPHLLILDDASSALDHATERSLQDALDQACAGMTRITVSQRVRNVRHADQILVLDHGEQCGLGTHAELIEGCEVYRAICRAQLDEKDDAGTEVGHAG